MFNQITQQFSLTEIATKVAEVAKAMGIAAKIDHLPNPRVEAEEHYYHAVHTRLEGLGLQPHLLNEDSISGLLEQATRHSDRVDAAMLAPRVNWRRLRNPVRGQA